MRPVSFVVVLLAAALSGCTGGDDLLAQPTTASPSSSAPAPSVDAETGSITGTVIDDEARPVAGAEVGIVEAKMTMETDEAGAFTMNQLLPGTYTVVANELGYESQAKKVEVRPGEVANVSFVLVPVAILKEPYYRPILRTAFLNVDQTWYATVASSAGQNHSVICGTCIFTLNVDKGAVQAMSENTYQQTGVPGYNDGLHLNYRVAGAFDNWGFCWREQRLWPAGTLTAVAGSGKAIIEVGSHFVSVSVQHRIDTWNTFAYLAELPEDFTTLPPTTEQQQNPSVCILK